MFDFTITEDQRRHLAFAVLEQIDSLYDSYEFHEPEVQNAIRHLEALQRILKPMGTGRPL
ncbi:MAG: hypothetical protein WBM09_13470 [Gallionella sp.]